MKLVDAVVFQGKKALREGKNDKSDNFEMDILNENALDKALEGPEKLYTGKEPGRKFMRSWMINNSKNQMLSFYKSLY